MEKEKQKYLIGGIIVAFAVCIGAGIFIYRSTRTKPEDAFFAYMDAVREKDYRQAYANVKTKISQETFTERLTNIYEGIDMNHMKVKINDIETENDITTINYEVNMNTIAGNLDYINTAKVTKVDGNYKMLWDTRQIFPDLEEHTHVSVLHHPAQRGTIYDRNGVALATQGYVYQIGLVANEMKDEKASISALSNIIHVSEETITQRLSASWVKKGLFVPIVTVP